MSLRSRERASEAVITSNPHRWRPSLRAVVISITGAAILAVVLLWPAIYNRFPLLFSDSGEYLFFAAKLENRRYRTLGYSLWIRGVSSPPNVWAAITAQAVLLAIVLQSLVRALAPGITAMRLWVGIAVVGLLTALPWFASQLMPDVFAPVTVIALYLIVAHWSRISVLGRIACVVGLAVGAASHVTHVVIGIVLMSIFAVAVRGADRAWLRVGLCRAAGAAAIGVASVVAVNFAISGMFVFARNGHAFLLGRLVDTGLAQRVLDDDCPRGVAYDLCPFRGELVADAAWFLWNLESPFQKIGEFDGTRAETARLLAASLRKYPGQHLALAVESSARQLVSIDSFDGLQSFKGARWMTYVVWKVAPASLPSLEAARQQQGTLGLGWLPRVHALAALLAALASLAVLWRARRDGRLSMRSASGFALVTWAAYVANALICANLSGVFDRYQARLAPLLVIAALTAAHAEWARAGEAAPTSEMRARPDTAPLLANG